MGCWDLARILEVEPAAHRPIRAVPERMAPYFCSGGTAPAWHGHSCVCLSTDLLHGAACLADDEATLRFRYGELSGARHSHSRFTWFSLDPLITTTTARGMVDYAITLTATPTDPLIFYWDSQWVNCSVHVSA